LIMSKRKPQNEYYDQSGIPDAAYINSSKEGPKKQTNIKTCFKKYSDYIGVAIVFIVFFGLFSSLYLWYPSFFTVSPPVPSTQSLLTSCPNVQSKKWNTSEISKALSNGLNGHENEIKQVSKVLTTSLSGNNNKATVVHFLGPNDDAKKIILENMKKINL